MDPSEVLPSSDSSDSVQVHSTLPSEEELQIPDVVLDNCSICLEGMLFLDPPNTAILQCGHKFHKNCLKLQTGLSLIHI